jgi:DNA-binding transcriptional ArsR family regulator
MRFAAATAASGLPVLAMFRAVLIDLLHVLRTVSISLLQHFDLHRNVRGPGSATFPRMATTVRNALNPDIATLASLIGDESRALVLQALGDGTSRPAGELARLAGVSAQTVSLHLSKLVDNGLLKVRNQGRFRYYSLGDARIAQILESLALLAPRPAALTQTQERVASRLHFARTCYRHLAGHVGVAITEALCLKNVLAETANGYDVTPSGAQWFDDIGIPVASLRARPLARPCIDWSVRKPHLAGPLADALAARLLALRWLIRGREPRVLRLTEAGRRGLREKLSLDLAEASGL